MTVPERWQEVIDLVLMPIAWIPRMQEALIAFFMNPAVSHWTMAFKYVFLLIPALLAVAAVWITMLSIYTLPFRASRVRLRVDDAAGLVGRRPGGVDLLGRRRPGRRRGGGLGRDPDGADGPAGGGVGPPGGQHPADDDGPHDADLLPAGRALDGVRDAPGLVRGGGDGLHVHDDPHRQRRPQRAGRRGRAAAHHQRRALRVPAVPRGGKLRVPAVAGDHAAEARVQVPGPDGGDRDPRDVLRDDVPLPAVHRRAHALGRSGDGRGAGLPRPPCRWPPSAGSAPGP